MGRQATTYIIIVANGVNVEGAIGTIGDSYHRLRYDLRLSWICSGSSSFGRSSNLFREKAHGH